MKDEKTDEALFLENGIRFCNYPFPPASVYPDGLITFESIEEIDPEATPPEARVAGEILFIPATLKDRLRAAAIERSIPSVMRFDVWGLMLEPFLDTEFDETHRERTFSIKRISFIDNFSAIHYAVVVTVRINGISAQFDFFDQSEAIMI